MDTYTLADRLKSTLIASLGTVWVVSSILALLTRTHR